MTGPLAHIEQVTAPQPLVALAEGHATDGDPAERAPAVDLRLRRAWPRGPDHLLLHYETPGGHAVAGQWFGDRGTPDGARLAKVAAATARSARAGAVAPLHHLGVLLQAAGADRRLTALAGLVGRPGATLRVHRPERRAVLSLDGPRGRRYAKVVRPARVEALVSASRRVAVTGVRTPQLLDVAPQAGVTLWSELPGRALFDLLDSRALIQAARAAGEALRRLHVGPEPSDPVHAAEDELAVVHEWVRRRATTSSGDDVEGRLDHLRRLLLEEEPAPMTLVHRDLYDRQVLVDDHGQVGLLDLDTLAAGEPSLDLANALVHLELRILQGRCAPEHGARAAAALVEGYAPAPTVLRRVRAYAAATRLRLACVYRYRPAWARMAPLLLEGLASSPFDVASY